MDHLERNLEKVKLQYIEEHLRCDHYCQGDKSSLAIYELDTDECLVREHIMRSAIFFVTKGQISLASMKDDNLIPAGHFYLKPAGSYFYCKAEEPSTIIRMSLDVDITFCNKLHIRDLKNHLTKPFPSHVILPILGPLAQELEATRTALASSLMCVHYQEAKVNVLLILLRAFYSKEELAKLFWPVVTSDVDFKKFVIRIAAKAQSVKELINLSGMPPTSFNRKFQQAFGISAGNWLTEKKKEGILQEIMLGEMSVAQIAEKFAFTPNYLVLFCKTHFGHTPMELRKMYSNRYHPR